MSAKKRRLKRKIAILLRMDFQWYGQARKLLYHFRGEKLFVAMQVAARKLDNMGARQKTINLMEAARRARGQRQ